MADGGEGTLAAVAAALGDRAVRRTVAAHDALGRPISADYLLLDGGRVAFVEMAAASGLAQLTVHERTPASARLASTRGTGELVRSARMRALTVILGLGGSATNDGGSGSWPCCVRFLDMAAGDLKPGGAALAELIVIDPSGLDPRLARVEFVVASDVTNPLTGPAGAAATYGPQKGADPTAVADLERRSASTAQRLRRRRDGRSRSCPGRARRGNRGGAAGLHERHPAAGGRGRGRDGRPRCGTRRG